MSPTTKEQRTSHLSVVPEAKNKPRNLKDEAMKFAGLLLVAGAVAAGVMGVANEDGQIPTPAKNLSGPPSPYTMKQLESLKPQSLVIPNGGAADSAIDAIDPGVESKSLSLAQQLRTDIEKQSVASTGYFNNLEVGEKVEVPKIPASVIANL
jgi:hypothetical protein